LLDYNDLGKAFYQRLLSPTGLKLIDFENFDRNHFHVVTELPCKNDEEEFRPDITLLINGLPLAFIEVKKPNNREGILAEHKRIKKRFKNPKFSRFFNITQLMVFSNNMEYDDSSPEPLEGAFYATPGKEDTPFNYFREEKTSELPALPELDPIVEESILRDNNLLSIRHTPEYATNKDPDTCGVFDEMAFETVQEAEASLRRNGFTKYSEDKEKQGFIRLPRGEFMEMRHPGWRESIRAASIG